MSKDIYINCIHVLLNFYQSLRVMKILDDLIDKVSEK